MFFCQTLCSRDFGGGGGGTDIENKSETLRTCESKEQVKEFICKECKTSHTRYRK